MIRELSQSSTNVIGLEVEGRVEMSEFGPLLERMDALFKERGRLDFLILVRDFSGYSAEAFWEDLKFGIRHWRDIGRLALVTDTRWLATVAKLENVIFPGKIRVFALADLEAARKWVEGSAGPS